MEGDYESFTNFRQICFYFAYFFSFLINMHKHGNDKNDFLQTQRIRQLSKASKFLDFPQHSINFVIYRFSNIHPLKINLSSIEAALRCI